MSSLVKTIGLRLPDRNVMPAGKSCLDQNFWKVWNSLLRRKHENSEFFPTLLSSRVQCMPFVNVTLPWYCAVLLKKPRSGSMRAWKTRELTMLKKMMLRAVCAASSGFLSLTSSPLTCTSCWSTSGSFQGTVCCCCLCHLGSERIFEAWQAAESTGYSQELISAGEGGHFGRWVRHN